MKINFDYKGSRFAKMALLSFFVVYVERNFHGYAAVTMIWAATALLSFTIRIDR
ncbi:hypothetical protein STW0522KLE39_28440 [Klebsiella quasipneumoniae]|nr:hypothetical protein STW0522KLE39_17530 [Klebsiella quasipneumoniae]BBV61196.1 hypothetical protein STW0522KLE39_28440 [Klebsiella quasipneumoniae]